MDSVKFWKAFKKIFSEKYNNNKLFKANLKGFIPNDNWTKGMEEVIHTMFKSQKYTCLGHNKLKGNLKEYNWEFLNIDFFVFDNNDYMEIENIWKNIGLIAIEHENNKDRIGYNISKLLNIKAILKVFIGYCNNKKEVRDTANTIKEQIEKMKKTNVSKKEELLLILGLNDMEDVDQYNAFKIDLFNGKMIELK